MNTEDVLRLDTERAMPTDLYLRAEAERAAAVARRPRESHAERQARLRVHSFIHSGDTTRGGDQ